MREEIEKERESEKKIERRESETDGEERRKECDRK